MRVLEVASSSSDWLREAIPAAEVSEAASVDAST